jgi:hypothetical protein
MAALSGPASTMTVLFGKTAADFFTKGGGGILGQRYGAKHAFQAGKRMLGSARAAFEDILGALANDHDGIAPVSSFPRFAKITLELSQRCFHAQSDNLITGAFCQATGVERDRR